MSERRALGALPSFDLVLAGRHRPLDHGLDGRWVEWPGNLAPFSTIMYPVAANSDEIFRSERR
jgi:hypothetical protein